MGAQKVNQASGIVLIALSLTSLITVLTGYFQRPQPDEGTGAHIFQLAIVLTLPAILVFLATADWKQPKRPARFLAIPSAALVLAFAALYYLEHVYYVDHFR